MYTVNLKQKFNSKSLTKSELIAVEGVSVQVLWTKYFLESHGYAVGRSSILQDNESAILLKNNLRVSKRKSTGHISIHNYFITGRVMSGKVDVQSCSADQMIDAFYTEPLQGATFRTFRDKILDFW